MKGYEFIKYLILNIFYYPLFYIFSYIIPKNKKLILLGASFGKHFSGNPKYYYLYLINNKENNFDFYWVTSNKKIFHDLKQRKYPVLYFFSIKTFFYILRAKYLIIDNAARDITYIVHLNGRFNIIQTWHGNPSKNLFKPANSSFYDKAIRYLAKQERKLYRIILVSSKSAAEIMQSQMSNINTKIIGYPRDDIFFDKKMVYVDYKKKLNLYKYNKVFLYAPTFRDNENVARPFSGNFLIHLNDYLKANGHILLIKHHPLFYEDQLRISDLFRLDNIQDVSDLVDDIQEILIHIDVLITDYSSVVHDFCLTNQPIVFYPYDYSEYTRNRERGFAYFQEMPGPFANNEQELFNLIRNINQWAKEKKYQERYQSFKNKFHQYQDGKSCERLYNSIINL